VFLAGWALDEGESIEQLLGLNEGSLVLPALRQVPFTNPDGSEGVDLYLDQEAFPAVFAGDVDPETAGVMAATQRPWSAAALSAPSGPSAWKSIPSWYLVGTEDKAIPAATQRFMAERATATIEEVPASHASMGFAAGGCDEADRHGGQRDGGRDWVGVAPRLNPKGIRRRRLGTRSLVTPSRSMWR
jgi:pimeloyl-ACP methyl ester carboxylesterase